MGCDVARRRMTELQRCGCPRCKVEYYNLKDQLGRSWRYDPTRGPYDSDPYEAMAQYSYPRRDREIPAPYGRSPAATAGVLAAVDDLNQMRVRMNETFQISTEMPMTTTKTTATPATNKPVDPPSQPVQLLLNQFAVETSNARCAKSNADAYQERVNVHRKEQKAGEKKARELKAALKKLGHKFED